MSRMRRLLQQATAKAQRGATFKRIELIETRDQHGAVIRFNVNANGLTLDDIERMLESALNGTRQEKMKQELQKQAPQALAAMAGS